MPSRPMCACAATADATWPLLRRRSERSRHARHARPSTRHHVKARHLRDRGGTLRRRYQGVVRFLHPKARLLDVFTYGEPPFYAQVKRDRALLNLKCVDYPVIDPALRDRQSLLSVDMGVDTHEEINQLFLEFQAAGITFFQTLRKEPWGAKTFIVKDPDGNLLLFAGPAD